MNKRLIASLLAVCVATGSGVQVPVQLLANTIDTHQSMSVAKERTILEENGIVSSQFTVANQPQYKEYEEIFKVTGIKEYKNNGRQYAQSVLANAFDGDVKTYWETGIANSDKFKNEVIITFEEIEEIDRIVYAPRPGNKGHVKQMSIYASLTEEGEDFKLIASGKTDIRGSLSEFKFKNTEFKRLKFVFDEANQGWAAAGEFMFFKEDQVADKMDRLFTDATMSQVSEEFNTVDSIKALELEAKSHPFYESYKENLLNAIAMVEQEEVIETNAKIGKFKLYGTPYIDAYDETFRVGSDRIVSITNNGGKYAQSVLKYAIDEDVNTHWETGKPNSATFKNEVIITLDQAEVIDRITYKSRQGGKGFAKNFTLYASTATKGDNFSKITTGEHGVTNDLLEVQFNPTKVRRLKFVFDNAQENWASIGDLRLYKEDKVQDKMETLFTNGLMNEVSEDFNTLEKLSVLEDEVKGHPLEEAFEKDIQKARDIIQGKVAETTKVVVAEQNGDMASHASKNLKFGFGNNNQPTGILAKPGDTITVYVDADPQQPLPKLFFSQQEGSFANWGRTVNLHVGENVITVPEVPRDKWYKHEVTKGGPIYIVNPYTPEQQSKAPVIRFVGGERFPFLTADTDVEEFKQFLIEYKERIDEDIKANPNVLDRKVIDTFEFVSDHIVWTGTATGAYKTYIEDGINPLDTIASYNTHMEEIFKYYGLDGSNINNDPKKIRENVRLAQPYGYMYAAGGHIGVQGDVMANHLVPFEKRGGSWGLTHEIGHKMDTGGRTIGEVTNNMLPMYMSGYYNAMDNRIPFESRIYINVMSENSNSYEASGWYFEKLAPFWQLELYKPGYWGELNKLYREKNATGNMYQHIVTFSSEVIGEDLAEYFARHGFNVTDETREATSKYPKPSKKIWYLNNAKFNYKGNGFSEPTHLEVHLTKDPKGTKLSFEINDEAQSDLLGYEIVRDGEIIGFTATNSFIDTNVEANKNYTYEIIPYDLNLETGESSVIQSFSPSVRVQQDKIIIGLNEAFNPMDYIKGLTYTGEDITSQVQVTHNVDLTEKGIYEVKYALVDQGITVEKVIQVEVVSSYDYLSDTEWKSAQTAWKTPRRNKDIKGRVNGEIKEFEKGFGIHANGQIVYDLSGKEYDRFEALLGVDMGIKAQNDSSIAFKVLGDGEVLATTKVIKHADDMVYINVPITGVSELVIEISDTGNGNTLDHSVIANPKLTTNNAVPALNIPKDEAVKVGESLEDIYGEYTATDAEDGDLTDQVEVSGIVDFDQPGYYPITYKVTDSDGNETIKTRNIAVVDMNDFTYVSDYDWISASAGAGSVAKDKAPNGRGIRLTDKNGKEVQFEKGLGAHARSVIKYDLTDLEADYFSAYVGVDRGMYGSVGSVAFEVWLDGEKVAETDVIRSRDAMEYLEVNLAGAKELMLVATDGGNGNGSDHSVWADAKFHYANENNIKVNTKELTQLVEEVAQLNPEDYTEVSWNLLVAVKEEALSLLEGSSTQEQVDEMVQRLKAAKENLVKVVNDTTLKDLVEKVNELEINLYTAKSSQVLQDKLKEANEVLGLENATQEVIDEAQKALEVAMNNLELSKGKAELHKLLEIANKMEESNYTEEADWAHFAEWTAYYNELYLDVTIHDEEMYEGVIAGYTAMIAEVESHRKPDQETVEVNTEALEQLMTSVSELELHLYTAESTQTLETKLKEAKELLNVETVTQEEIDLARGQLEEAIDHLELSKGKAELYKLLEIANQMEESNYTDEADWAHFAEWTAYYNKLYLDVTIHDEEMYEGVIAGYTAMIAEVESHRKPDQETVEVNTEALEKLITSVSELELHLYTAESTQILETKLKEAKELINLETVKQEEIDLARGQLEEAIDHLELSKGKAELYKLLEIANAMEESNYTEEADWAGFAEWTAYYNELYLDVTIHDEEMYEGVIAGYAAMIAEVESHRIEKTVVDEPAMDEPVMDEPVMDEPVMDEPVMDEPVIDEPVMDEPVIDEPAMDEPAINEPVIDEQ